jgi:flagellar biosynthesis chaperone FliJ
MTKPLTKKALKKQAVPAPVESAQQIGQAARLYAKYEEQLAKLKADYEAACAPLKEKQAKIMGFYADVMAERRKHKLDTTIKTNFGTFYTSQTKSASVNDKEAFMAVVIQKSAYALLEVRACAVEVEKWNNARILADEAPLECVTMKVVETVKRRKA